MAYTPELSLYHSRILRRIAWALGIPMTKAIEVVLEHVAKIVDPKKVCKGCRDSSLCETCPIKKQEVSS